MIVPRVVHAPSASIRLSSIRPTPACLVASEISLADSDSPSALTMAAFLSWSLFRTTYFALSASCSATCFCSIALENSIPNWRCVIATSSMIRLKSLARLVRSC